MKVLYASEMCSPRIIKFIHHKTGKNPGFAMQKFNRLIAEGFQKNGMKVITLSGIPTTWKDKNYFSFYKNEKYKNIIFNYIPTLNFPLIRHLGLLVWSFLFTLFWGIFNKNKYIISDVLDKSISIGVLLASKINRVPICGIVTDHPGLIVGAKHSNFIGKISNLYLGWFDCYVFLTEAMNNVINKRNKPYIVMEGLVDSDVIHHEVKMRTKSIIYAGKLHERYGLKLLIEAFIKLGETPYTLDLYGDGAMVNEISDYCKTSKNIIYHGVVSNEEITNIEKSAFLLVNPRPVHEDFTKYSFPSKNMEYMLSGTPVLTTKLPGMPTDHYPFVFLVEKVTVQGFYDALLHIISSDEATILKKGEEAQKYVLTTKNNIIQSKRIIELLKNCKK